MLIPIVQGRLETKLKDDLERLKGLLGGLDAGAGPRRCCWRCWRRRRRARRRSTEVGAALRQDPVYVDPDAELAGDVDADALREKIRAGGDADLRRGACPPG